MQVNVSNVVNLGSLQKIVPSERRIYARSREGSLGGNEVDFTVH